ncbi:hypothetical protein VMCG_00177 [Cytospora schulzeri]|uniref:Zn(2)-C6 fungal-type domain-containing protein n=1 Tax=Cytospora schulzeri TaxID=448051 RepID=A0A423X9J7_9PEZI|nr:hypothetical protein VMCG_00177 [Valsa malicola]
MSSEDVSPTEPTPAPAPDSESGLEALACVSCRSRKLKCDRIKPACTRCARLKSECVYPESRRKPAFKRRNVKELEERLAQVEVLLKDAAGKAAAFGGTNVQSDPFPDEGFGVVEDDAQNTFLPDPGFHGSGIPPDPDAATDPLNWNFESGVHGVPGVPGVSGFSGCNGTPHTSSVPFTMPDMHHEPRAENAGATRHELLGLGLFESLPPAEMIEDLHQTFFRKQHPLIPIVHPGRYMQAFYSGPHLRPPMALSYAIWTMAANGHEKYSSYHDVFHRRARHYLAEDELKGEGEHFLTVAHAQAWALLATNEARCMWFTRAAMSAASCIKLIHMMGLHRLDDPNASVEMAPTIAPPRDWTELEERRRVFWGALCIDSHASISTGWPCLINFEDVTTHLPSSEEAFSQCREEKTCRLEDVFTGSSYSSFAGAAIICHIFNQILKHVHRSKPGDFPDNFEHGPYWNRHRELDNLLSSAFMFLPEKFRLPKHVRDPVAVHTNLNLHASVICLHNSAYEMANEHNLPESVKQMSKTRLLTASQEIVNIVKLTSHANAGYRSPLVSLALYVASAVYITMAQDGDGGGGGGGGLEPIYKSNLEFLLTAMAAIGKLHAITQSFFRQAVVDLRRGGLLGLVRVPAAVADMLPADPDDGPPTPCGNNIPLFARSRLSRNTDILPPLPGRLPLNDPVGRRAPGRLVREVTHWNVDSRGHRDGERGGEEEGGGGGGKEEEEGSGHVNKRKRVAVSPDPVSLRPGNDPSLWFLNTSGTDATVQGSSLPSAPGGGFALDNAPNAARFRLPHRAGPSTGSSPSAGAGVGAGAGNCNSTPNSTTQPSSGVSPGTMLSNEGMANAFGAMAAAAVASQDGAVDLDNIFQDLDSWAPAQDDAAGVLYAQVTEESMQGGGGGGGGGGFVASSSDTNNDGWMLLNETGVSDDPWDTGPGGRGGGG